MCTVSWIHDNSGYQVFFNRDEKRSRKPALSPVHAIRNGVRYIAPIDGDFGGAWIATNEFGVTCCLLNGAAGSAQRSRGWLVLDLIAMPSLSGVLKVFDETDLTLYAPFTAIALEPGTASMVFRWDGVRRVFETENGPRGMRTSSSFDTAAVLARREAVFGTAENLYTFHLSHADGASPYSVCMHRPDAETVSFSHISVSREAAEFTYVPSAPCRACQTAQVTLTQRVPVHGEGAVTPADGAATLRASRRTRLLRG